MIRRAEPTGPPETPASGAQDAPRADPPPVHAGLIALVVGIAVLGVGGNVFLLVQETRGRVHTRGWNARLLRALSVGSIVVVLGTLIVVARPWYWDLALGAVAVVAFAGIIRALRALRSEPPRGPLRRIVGHAASAVGLGVILLGMAGVAGALDGASLSSNDPLVAYHGGPVLRAPVLYQVFWGSEWSARSPAVRQASAFETHLADSMWARSITGSGFGVTSVGSGGCWIDPSPPARPGEPVAGTATGPFPAELRAVSGGSHRVVSCDGHDAARVPAAFPADAVVALWLSPQVEFDINGVAAHGTSPWPGRPRGLVVAGLPGAYAQWGEPSCRRDANCAAIPAYALPSYALSHELVEAITNPYGKGWYAEAPLPWTARFVLSKGPPALLGLKRAPAYPGEVADLCAPGTVIPDQRVLVGRLAPGEPLPVAAFFRPGVGCVTG